MSSEAQGDRAPDRDVAKKHAKAKGAKPEDFINIALLKEIDQSGFFDKLDKK